MIENKKPAWAFPVSLLVMMLFTGCVAPSTLVPYPNQTARVRQAMVEDRLDHAYEILTPETTSNDVILYLQERGRVSSIDEAYQKSNEDFQQAASLIEENQRKAKISLSNLSNAAMGTVANDNVIPYPGYGYEKVFIHTFEALNYLAQSKLEDALVEVRRAQNEQSFAEYIRKGELAKAEQDAKKHDLKVDDQTGELAEVYKQLNLAVGEVKSEFQNAYTFYVSGMLYEMLSQYDNARVSYQKALEIYPENNYIKNAVKRNAKWGSGLSQGEGRVVVLYEQGFVPSREQIKFLIPWNGRLYTITIPFYGGHSQAGPPLYVGRAGASSLGKTETVCITRALAARALKDDYPTIIIRHLLRLIVRDQVQKKSQEEEENRSLLSLGTALLGFIIDNADLRSWLTLPQSAQVADFKLPVGNHTLTFGLSKSFHESHTIDVRDGEITVVRVITLGPRMWVQVLQ